MREKIHKRSNITALTDLRGKQPLIQIFRPPKTARVRLDMHYVRRIDATGLNLFFSAVAKITRGTEALTIQFELPEDVQIAALLRSDGARQLVDLTEENREQMSLLDGQRRKAADFASHTSHIAYVRNIGQNFRDRTLAKFRNDLKSFFGARHDIAINRHQLMMIFSEMVKNTLDHSDADASLGVDVAKGSNGNVRLTFSYCEQGLGLSKSLRHALKDHAEYRGRARKGSFSDLIHWALQPGNSTKSGNDVNFGLGMTMIIASANGMGMSIDIVDAESVVSLAGLSETHSHLELRRRFVACSDFPCFSYIGELELDQ